MDSTAAQRRLKAIHGHLLCADDSSSSQLRHNPTAGEYALGKLSLSLSHRHAYTHTYTKYTRKPIYHGRSL